MTSVAPHDPLTAPAGGRVLVHVTAKKGLPFTFLGGSPATSSLDRRDFCCVFLLQTEVNIQFEMRISCLSVNLLLCHWSPEPAFCASANSPAGGSLDGTNATQEDVSAPRTLRTLACRAGTWRARHTSSLLPPAASAHPPDPLPPSPKPEEGTGPVFLFLTVASCTATS